MLGQKASNVWYGDEQTVCWIQPELPFGFAFEPHLAQTYVESGWCFVEAIMSASVKAANRRLDLSRRTQTAMEFAYGGSSWDTGWTLESVCSGPEARMPPLPPEEVRRLLQTAKKFTASTDLDRVDQLYHTFFEGVLQTTKINMKELGWTEMQARQLVAVLPRFTALTSVDLSGNELGVKGGAVLAGLLPAMSSLTECNVCGNKLDRESATMLANVATEKRIMLFGITHDQKEADFSNQNLSLADVTLIASDLAVSNSLTQCNMRGVKLDIKTALTLARIGTQKGTMLYGIKPDQKEADFRGQLLGPMEAMLIACDLAVSTSLLSVCTPAHNRASTRSILSLCSWRPCAPVLPAGPLIQRALRHQRSWGGLLRRRGPPSDR